MSHAHAVPGERETGVAEEERWLRQVALRLARASQDDAEDLVQETFLVAMRRPPPAEVQLRPWLFGILKKLHLGRLRSRARSSRAAWRLGGNLEAPDATETAIDAERTLEILRREIAALREPYRGTLQLLYVDGLPAVRAAELLGVPAETIRKRHQLALAKLRERLDRAHGGRRALWTGVLLALFGSVAAERVASARPTRRGAATRWGTAAGVVAAGAALTIVLTAPRAPARRASTATAAATEPSFIDAAIPRVRVAENQAATPPADDCSESLAALVASVPSGGTLVLPPCLYREPLLIDRPMHVDGGGRAEIRGSDVWTDFERTGDVWTSRVPLPSFERPGPDLVFVDGRRLGSVAADATPRSGEMALLPDRRLVIADDPRLHTVEVTTRAHLVDVRASHVVVTGLRLQHAGSGETDGAVRVPYDVTALTFTGNDLRFTRAAGLSVRGDDHRIEDNVIADTGAAGIVIHPGARVVVRGNRVERARFHMHAWDRDKTWVGAGITLIGAHAAVEENLLVEQGGVGILCMACRQSRIAHNQVARSAGAGIVLYRGRDNALTKNRLWYAGFGTTKTSAGVHLASSANAVVSDNVLVHQPIGIKAEGLARGCSSDGFVVVDNLLLESRVGAALVVDAPACEAPLLARNRAWSSTLASVGGGVERGHDLARWAGFLWPEPER